MLPAQVATPLAVVLNELLQNAVDHAYPPRLDLTDEPGRVHVVIDRDDDKLGLRVVDDGVGLAEGFDLATSPGLGLSIVRTLVTSDLNGEISVHAGPGEGDRPGTEVELRVPIPATDDGGLA
jgi:two-component sensor histidine kinase